MRFNLPELPYSVTALEPFISAETLKVHHGKHHAAYVAKLNTLLRDDDPIYQSLEDVILGSAYWTDKKALFNNAAQAWNHEFYWNCMSPNGGGRPSGLVEAAISRDFRDFENFRARFVAAATGHFGSGWVWLVLEGGALRIVATRDAVTPMIQNQTALLTCDLWEHAYYLDYQNRRQDYVEVFLEHVVNWEFVERQLLAVSDDRSAA